MGLEECFHEALRHNENVPSEQEAVNQADENVNQAWGSIVPNISLNKTFFWQETPPPTVSPTGTLLPQSNFLAYQPTLALTASQPLFQGFREYEGLKKTCRLLGKERATKENVDLGIYKSVVAGYYSILNLERDKLNLKEEMGYLQDRIKELQRQHRIGRSQLTDVLTAKTQSASLEVKIEADRNQLTTARTQFALLTGLPVDTPLNDDAGLEVPAVDSLDHYTERIKDRPDVRAAQRGAEAADNAVNIAFANHLPSVALTGNYYFDRPANFNGIDWDAKVVVTFPIFAGGVTQSQVRQAYSQSHQADLALSLARRSADQEIRSLYDNVASDLKQIQLNQENVSLSESAFKEEQHSYRLGLVTNLDVLTSLTNYIEAKRSYDTNRFNLKMHYLTLRAAAAIR
jgi:outer membrane protein